MGATQKFLRSKNFCVAWVMGRRINRIDSIYLEIIKGCPKNQSLATLSLKKSPVVSSCYRAFFLTSINAGLLYAYKGDIYT
jgi:hypothetical protein